MKAHELKAFRDNAKYLILIEKHVIISLEIIYNSILQTIIKSQRGRNM